MRNVITLACVILFIGGCAPESNQNNREGQNNTLYNTDSVSPEILIPADTIREQVETQQVAEPKYGEVTTTPDKSGTQRITYTLRDAVIDSLNKIVPVFDATKFNNVSVSYFTNMASSLNGKAFFVNSADKLIASVMEVLTTRVDDGTDVVFLIDKTGSMDDDIEQVKQSMTVIVDALEKHKNVKLGIAAYGDKNWHFDLWYNSVALSSDANRIRDFMNSFTTIGNPDIAESVNDAIVRTVKTMNWTPGNNRILLVIGDAPSLEPPYATFSSAEVVKVCRAANVRFNMYPLIVAANPSGFKDKVFKTDFVKVYPNPVDDILNTEFTESSQFYFSMYNMNGQLEMKGAFSGWNDQLRFNMIQEGNYILQIYNANSSKFFTEKIVVKH